MFSRLLNVHSGFLLIILKCCLCSNCGTDDNSLDVPLITTLNAPLKADLDITALTNQLKTLILREVGKGVKEAIGDIVNSTVNTRIEEAEQKLEKDITKTVLTAVETLKQDTRDTPAFTAILSKDFTPSVNRVIVFDSVKTNNGGHYSRKTGVFTAPKPGLYMFSATLRSGGKSHLHCELVVNNTMFVKIHGYNSNDGTSNAVLRLKTGDRVFVRKDYRSGERMLGRFWSMFSGYLIA